MYSSMLRAAYSSILGKLGIDVSRVQFLSGHRKCSLTSWDLALRHQKEWSATAKERIGGSRRIIGYANTRTAS